MAEMREIMRLLGIAASVAALVASLPVALATAQENGATREAGSAQATAQMVDGEGRTVGAAYLRDTPNGVLLKLELKNATPGPHALHIHEVGKCERPSFESAGGHFNPDRKKHGIMSAAGPHAGDLPNIEVPTSTQLSVEFLVPGLTLAAGPRSILDANGSALMIHSTQDDYKTDPAGGAGDRLVCGEIKAVK